MSDKKARAKQLEKLNRIFTVQGWIVEGVQSALIIRNILNLKWCTSQRQAERYLKSARDLWTDIPKMELKQKRDIKVSELQQIKRNMSEEYKKTPGGVRALIAVEKEIILLEGLRMPTKVELTGEDGKPIETKNTQVIVYLPDNGRTK